eukprot:TRINITY_DN56161_c0_g1_i1.p3 TRINITY_DN56161_c0_g1~~TRINITY_DN56161_c0_g1_i1.p3  ORF type:complete len:108 (-),score=23.78 TRINITY_DN56161_c0_g1_i1:74-352(-)
MCIRDRTQSTWEERRRKTKLGRYGRKMRKEEQIEEGIVEKGRKRDTVGMVKKEKAKERRKQKKNEDQGQNSRVKRKEEQDEEKEQQETTALT